MKIVLAILLVIPFAMAFIIHRVSMFLDVSHVKGLDCTGTEYCPHCERLANEDPPQF